MRKVVATMVSFVCFLLVASGLALASTSDATPVGGAGTPTYKDPSFWIMVGSGVLGLVFTILGAFGYTKWAKNERFKMVLKVADNAISWFKDYAQKSDAKWDDIVAAILEAVAARLGDLSDEEVATVKKIVEVRKRDLLGDDVSEDEEEKDEPAEDASADKVADTTEEDQ